MYTHMYFWKNTLGRDESDFSPERAIKRWSDEETLFSVFNHFKFWVLIVHPSTVLKAVGFLGTPVFGSVSCTSMVFVYISVFPKENQLISDSSFAIHITNCSNVEKSNCCWSSFLLALQWNNRIHFSPELTKLCKGSTSLFSYSDK